MAPHLLRPAGKLGVGLVEWFLDWKLWRFMHESLHFLWESKQSQFPVVRQGWVKSVGGMATVGVIVVGSKIEQYHQMVPN